MTFIGRHCTTSEKPIHVDTASIPIKTFDRFMRPSRRHWRLLAFVGLLAFVVLVLFDSQREVPKRRLAILNDILGLARPTGRILVTGGAGMIGKEVVTRLLLANMPVTVLDLSPAESHIEKQIQLLRATNLTADVRFVRGDVRDPSVLSKAWTSDITGVIHLAGYSRAIYCEENERDCVDVNVRGTQAILGHLKNGWIIYPSSMQVYGGGEPDESAPMEGKSAYARTQLLVEDSIRAHVLPDTGKGKRKKVKANAHILRLAPVYGSTSDHGEDVVADVMKLALANRPIQVVGDPASDLLHFSDAVAAILHSADALQASTFESSTFGMAEVFNIGPQVPIKVSEYVRKILTLTGSGSPVRSIPDDGLIPPSIGGDVSKAHRILGFHATLDLDTGLRRLYKDHLEETVEYLSRKRKAECSVEKEYTMADLLALNGCTGTLAADVDGQPYYAVFDPAKGADSINNGRPEATPATYAWRDDDEPQGWRFELAPKAGKVALRLKRTLPAVKDGEGRVVEKERNAYFEHEGRSTFLGTVDTTGYVALTYEENGAPVVPWTLKPPIGRRDLLPSDPDKTRLGVHRFRLTPFCCPGMSAPWPFFEDDLLASNILDARLGTTRRFNASQLTTRCERLRKAEEYAGARLNAARTARGDIPLAALPTGRAADWKLRDRDVCTNLCDHPTICVDTGDCVCGQSACPSERFPFADVANTNLKSFSGSGELEGGGELDQRPYEFWMGPKERGIKFNGSWQNMLRSQARRYIAHAKLPKFNVTRIPDDEEKAHASDPDKYDRVQTEWHGCFSADSVMERGARLLSHAYEKGSSLVFLPYYSWTLRFPDVAQWTNNALEHHLPKGFDTADLILPFTFDWGRCNTVLHGLYRVREWSSSPTEIMRASSWQPMGDVNSQCYFMDQDVVIPARTCRQEDLRRMFGDISQVKPVRERSTLVFFKGAPNGAGRSVRDKIACDRPYKDYQGRLTNGNALARYWNQYRPETVGMSNEDAYIATIGDTVFCPVPRGTAGWSPRITDTLYTGCIPVLLGDQTHMPFWDVLDWSKFSVTVYDWEVESLEHKLMSYSWDEVERLQANIILVREAFLYPNEGHMEDNLVGHGPFFMAAHSAGMLKHTAYPTKV